jgi:hypothetical protein
VVARLGAHRFRVSVQAPVESRQLETGVTWMERAHGAMLVPPAVVVAIGLTLIPPLRRSTSLTALRPVAGGFAVVLGLCLLAVLQLDLSTGYRWALSCVAVTVVVAAFIPVLLLPTLIALHRHR